MSEHLLRFESKNLKEMRPFVPVFEVPRPRPLGPTERTTTPAVV